jgi:putative restriction endonuclease
MTKGEIRDRFHKLGVWESGDERAPYKPLLLLYILGRYLSGGERLVEFQDLDAELLQLFKEFGPPRKSYHTVYPFWYLQTNEIWQVVGADNYQARKGKAGEPTKKWLRENRISGGLRSDVFRLVTTDRAFLQEIVNDLLQGHFRDTVHDALLAAVGLEQVSILRAKRDPKFRQLVLLEYGYRCAVCEFDARISETLVGIEAVHIREHQSGGPSTINNGMALCSLHHQLFDRGAFTLTTNRLVEVSKHVNGGESTNSLVKKYHSRPLPILDDPNAAPALEFIDWHRSEVFRGPGLRIE